MKERPILFNGEMVRAVLDGRKSQTRRVIKPQPVQPAEELRQSYAAANATDLLPEWWWSCAAVGAMLDVTSEAMLCRSPYGVPGDELWVRETWASGPAPGLRERMVVYRADLKPTFEASWKWKPSIHMKRADFRIQLLVKDVRVERINSISVADALAEGIAHSTLNDPRVEFQWLWDSINGSKPGCSWSDNPFVWVIEYERKQA